MRWFALLSLCWVLGCGQAVEPPVMQYGVRDGREPVVRVHLRSIGSDWQKLPVSGKDGLVVERDGVGKSTAKPYVLEPGAGRVVMRPLGGIVSIGGHTYAGRLVWEKGKLVNHVTMENYVLGVLRGELPLPNMPQEAAAAQAIAVRAYTMHYLAQDRAVFDVDDTTLYQRYVGLKYAPDDDALRAGVRATTGLYLEDGGKPLKAYYHSTCGGHTTDVPTGLGRPPVKAMSGVACDHCKISKYYRWKSRLADGEIVKASATRGSLRSFEVVERGVGDRATQFEITTRKPNRTVASDFRLRVGASKLRSTRILDLQRVDGGYLVEGGGWGHGVGLCQMGAIGQARKGSTGREIVAYYYPGARIKRAY